MPPCMIGCFIPKSSVMRVFIDARLPWWLLTLSSEVGSVKLSGDLQITTEMMVGGAELHIDGSQPLEIAADLQLIAHTHAAMDLHRLLANELCRFADLHLGAGGRLGALARVAGEGQSGQIAHRQRLLVGNEHVDHPVL